jgi:hypothetical protein
MYIDHTFHRSFLSIPSSPLPLLDDRVVSMNSLLGLPPRIRAHILEKVVLDKTPNLRLLQVCRQLYDETLPLIYQRQLVFDSQADLFHWMEGIDRRHLDHIQSIQLTIDDLEVAESDLDDRMLSPAPPTWGDYHEEAQKIHDACMDLPAVTEIIIRRHYAPCSQLQHDFYELILSRVPRQWPALRRLSFDGAEGSIRFLKMLPELRAIAFTGFSKSTPMETVTVLSRLRHLTDIELILPNSSLASQLGSGTPGISPAQSLTREVIKSLRGLRCFTIRERRLDLGHRSAFFDKDFLQALDSAHRSSLRTLNVWLDFTPDTRSQRALHALLSASSLKNLRLEWPDFSEQLLDFLPRTLTSIRMPVCDPRMPEYALLELAEQRAEMSGFRSFTVLLDPEVSFVRM